MKSKIFTLALILSAFCSSVFAKDKNSNDHFKFEGTVFEHIIKTDEYTEAANVQIMVYQDQELFVAFNTKENGTFQFEFPLGHQYEIVFGGGDFVNKKIDIDARSLKPRNGGYELNMDIRLFRPITGFDFAMLNDPFVKFDYDKEYGQFVPNEMYSAPRAKELDKLLKKAKKGKP
jgi:hypothetical protein